MALASFKFNQGLAAGNTPSVIYQALYKDTTVFWKGADNQVHEVMIESVCEALEASMLHVASLLGV